MHELLAYGALALPTVLIPVCVVGVLLSFAWRRIGTAIALAAGIALYAAATPAFSGYLLHHLESDVSPAADFAAAGAIVVLGGDVHGGGGQEPDRPGPVTLERLFYAADAFRHLRLPVAVSGGIVGRERTAVAELMRATLEQSFAVPVEWTETRSRTTFENAAETAKLLKADDIATVVVVTNAWHMKRSLWSFRRVGMTPLPWPAPRTVAHFDRVADFLPSAGGLFASFEALHEMIGGLYYRWRY